MARFPQFFEEHAVLPPGVREPTDRTDWELEVIRRLSRDEPGGQGAGWMFGDVVQEFPGAFVPVAVADDNADAALEPLDVGGEVLEPGWRDELESGRHRRTDAIAWYQPWHLYGDDWGIYFDGPVWRARVREVMRRLPRSSNVTQGTVERDVFEQVLAHEQTHFASEVLGTQLEAIFGRSGYRDYVLATYSFRNAWTIGAPEEILATHNEVNGGQPGVLRDTAKRLARAAPPGYAEWETASAQRDRELIEASIAARMITEAGADVRWPTLRQLGRRVLGSVPMYWRFGGAQAPGFLRRSVAPITPQGVRRYLRSHGFVGTRQGHHETWVRNSVVVGFSVQGHDVPTKEHSPIAKNLGFAKPIELRRAMAHGTPPPALAARTASPT